jgi:hypothetical protein
MPYEIGREDFFCPNLDQIWDMTGLLSGSSASGEMG